MTEKELPAHARVVVIGGGVVGCSVLYHLAKRGWTDSVLLERSELTSGSTWHAAGGMHTINGDPNVAKLQKYTISLYKEIEELSGQSVGLHMPGGVMLAATEARFDWLKSMAAKGTYLDIEAEIITPEEAAETMPLLDPRCFVGAMRTKVDGHLDPSGTTHAYAKSARKLGASIFRHTKAEACRQKPDGTWIIETDKGRIEAEHLVNAGGLWAREVGRMAGLELPVLAMEHMYLLTEDMPEVAEHNQRTGQEVVHAVDFDGELYLRQERGGMLMGTYERACKPWSEHETPWNFGHELLEPDLERIAPSLEVGFRHFPAFENAGIKQIINGPFTFAPDGNPLIGPVRGLTNYWTACGVMAGFSQGGGVGLALSSWMVDGDPGMDVFAMDIARFGDWAGMTYTNAKVRENYSRRFSIRFPNEELPAARGLRTTPIHSKLERLGAQFGVSAGIETPLWFAPDGLRDVFSWRRSADFEPVNAEACNLRENCGIMESSGFAKYWVSGEGAHDWLDHILACRIPDLGRIAMAPMLKDDGKLIGDFTLAHIRQGQFMIVGSGLAEDYHMRWFEQHLPKDGSVRLKACGLGLSGLAIAGPKSRDLLQSLTHADLSTSAFPHMHTKEMLVGLAPVICSRISYTGDFGYELWMKPEYQNHVFGSLWDAGHDFGLRPIGSRALNALRLEKGYGSWAREYRPIYGPAEAGLGRFTATGKAGDFIGKTAAIEEKRTGGQWRLKTFVVEAGQADAIGDEPIYHQGEVQGWITSGGYASASGLSVAMGYIPKNIADESEGFEIELLGERLSARPQDKPLFDPEGTRMRA